MPATTGQWELFNLAEDPGETNDLARAYPDLLADLIGTCETFATDTGVVY